MLESQVPQETCFPLDWDSTGIALVDLGRFIKIETHLLVHGHQAFLVMHRGNVSLEVALGSKRLVAMFALGNFLGTILLWIPCVSDVCDLLEVFRT